MILASKYIIQVLFVKKVVVIGAGPAGLTAAYELSKYPNKFSVTILEESGYVGGISKTVEYHGNRMDIGGHRFISEIKEVNEWWDNLMPVQGIPAKDYVLLNRSCATRFGGPDPELDDRVMLVRNRLSRIFFRKKFFDYPINLKLETLKNMGIGILLIVGSSYLRSIIFKRKENSLEDFYINRFGKKLYSMFFENYTENLWGRHPSDISPEWGAQRVKGLSIIEIAKNVAMKALHIQSNKVGAVPFDDFFYPKFGPGQLWEIVADELVKRNVKIIEHACVTKLIKSNNIIESVLYKKDGKVETIRGDYIISSMPLKDLVMGMTDVPKQYKTIAAGLPYRDYMIVGVLVSRLKLKNETSFPTIGNIIPDNWIYVHDPAVKMGRFQVYNNWSPYMVKDPDHTVWLGLEYFCDEGDEMWNQTDEAFAQSAIEEMVKMELIDSTIDVIDYHVERLKKAYPAYFDTYEQVDDLRSYLDTIHNLFCVGRNGQHRYSNIDHSMCTSFEAVNNIVHGITDKSNIWNVNTMQIPD